MSEDIEGKSIDTQKDRPESSKEPDKSNWKIPRRTFLLLAGSYVLARQGSKDYGPVGEEDPSISRALEREGVSNVNLRMFFGNHVLTDETFEKFKEIGTDIITGEIAIDFDYFIDEPKSEDGLQNDDKKILTEQSLLDDFIGNITRDRSGSGVGSGLSEYVGSFQNWSMAYHREDMGICSMEGDSRTNTWSNINSMIGAGSRVNSNRKKLYYLSLLASAGWDFKSMGLLKRKMSRRDFLKLGAAAGVGAATILRGGRVLAGVNETLKQRELISHPPNKEVTGLFSKLTSFNDNAQEFMVEIQEDKETYMELVRLVRMRNEAMALNIWYLTNVVGDNEELRRKITGNGGNAVQISAMAGLGHAAVKEHFLRDPKELEKAVRGNVEFVMDNYLVDVTNTSAETKEISDFYGDILAEMSKPKLSKKSSIEFNASKPVEVSTPQWIFYQAILERIKGAEERGKFEEVTKLQGLLGNVLIQHLESDIPDEDIIGIAVGVRRNDYDPKDEHTIRRRLKNAGVIPKNASPGTASVEVRHNIGIAPYRYDDREVGVLVINNVPFPFYEKETIPEELALPTRK